MLLKKLRDKLTSAGKAASMVRLRSETPDLERYDGLIFCSPVNGGAPADAEELLCQNEVP